MTSQVVPLKQCNTQSWISLEVLTQCSSNLAPETNITKERKWHPLCHCHDNSYAADPVLIKTKIPRFYLKQGSSTPNNLTGRVKTIWETCIRGKTLCPTFKGWIWGYLVFHRKRLEPRVLPWQKLSRCHSLPFVMHISGAKFEEHCFNISRGIVDWVLYCFSGTICDVITFLICIIQKHKYLHNKKRYSKKENAILLWFEKPFK